MTKRTYKSILTIFERLGKDKITTSDVIRESSMKRDSVYQTLSRAVRDNVLKRDEFGFYYILDKEQD